MITLGTRYKRLRKNQIELLSSLLMVHGNGTALVANTGLNRMTLQRAAEGKPISEKSYDAIETYLAAIEEQLNNNPE